MLFEEFFSSRKKRRDLRSGISQMASRATPDQRIGEPCGAMARRSWRSKTGRTRTARSNAYAWRGIRRVRRRWTTLEALFTDFFEIHGDRRFADDGAIVAGLARIAITAGRDRRAAARPLDRRSPQAKFRQAASRGLSQGGPRLRARRPLRSAAHHLYRYAGRGAGSGRGGARAGRGDRAQPRADGAARGSVDRMRDRRGRFGRRARAGSRQRRADTGERVSTR